MSVEPRLNGVPFVQSPNFSSRRGFTPSAIVLHYTAGGSAAGSQSWLCNPDAKASAHFLISRSGDTRQLVDLTLAAWHCGVAELEHRGEMPSRQREIGIELANHGYLYRLNGSFFYEIGRGLKRYRGPEPKFARLEYDNGREFEGYFEPYQPEQIEALQELLLKLKSAGYSEAVANLVGHEEIGMPLGRKSDPGPLFPWDRFWRKIDQRTRAHTIPPPSEDVSRS